MKPLSCSALMLPIAVALGAMSVHPAQVHAGLPMRTRSSPLPIVPASPPPSLTMQPPPGPPQPPVGALTTSNYSLNREVVRRVIYVHINQIRYCYQQALVKQPTLAG